MAAGCARIFGSGQASMTTQRLSGRTIETTHARSLVESARLSKSKMMLNSSQPSTKPSLRCSRFVRGLVQMSWVTASCLLQEALLPSSYCSLTPPARQVKPIYAVVQMLARGLSRIAVTELHHLDDQTGLLHSRPSHRCRPCFCRVENLQTGKPEASLKSSYRQGRKVVEKPTVACFASHLARTSPHCRGPNRKSQKASDLDSQPPNRLPIACGHVPKSQKARFGF